jgi:SAM-dependent methyltransferase
LTRAPESLAECDWARYDFLDLGAGEGGSLDYARRRFDAGRGLGIELSPERAEAARQAGFDVVVADATQLGVRDRVRFVSMMDFLEHLPGLESVRDTLAAAADSATDFLFIFHPSFEGEDYLRELGLSLQWSRDEVHTAHIQVSDYCNYFDELGLRQYMIRYLKPIESSDHEAVVHVEETDPGYFHPDTHIPKPSVVFERPVWRAQEIFVALRPLPAAEWARITRPAVSTSLQRPAGATV